MRASIRAAAWFLLVFIPGPSPTVAQLVTQQFVLPAGGSILLGVTLEGSNSAPTTLGELLPSADWDASASVFIWSPSNATPRTFTRARSGWNASTSPIYRGEALLVGPAAASPVHMVGWTPTQATTSFDAIATNTAFAFPYPAAITWTASDLAVQSPPGTVFHTRNHTGQVLQSYMKTRSGWLNATNTVLQTSEAFFWDCPSTMTWTVDRPY